MSFRLFAAALLLVVGVTSANAAIVYDVEDDFSTTNPSGQWTFGRYGVLGTPPSTTPDTADFTAFTVYTPNIAGPIDLWELGGTDPNVNHNDSGSVYINFGITWQPNQVNVSPAGATYAGIRFTTPTTGVYTLASDFTNVQGFSDKDVFVYINGVQQMTAVLGGAPVFYNQPALALNVGDVVDFVVSGGNNVAVDATFSIVPEPTSIGLLACGAVGLVALGKRRRQAR